MVLTSRRDALLRGTAAAISPYPQQHHTAVFPHASMNDRMRVMQRQPRRISITLSYQVHDALLSRSEEEGRSLSNLCAFLLEEALRDASRLLHDGKASLTKTSVALGNGDLGLRRDLQSESWRQRH
jgi:hypothetical protein